MSYERRQTASPEAPAAPQQIDVLYAAAHATMDVYRRRAIVGIVGARLLESVEVQLSDGKATFSRVRMPSPNNPTEVDYKLPLRHDINGRNFYTTPVAIDVKHQNRLIHEFVVQDSGVDSQGMPQQAVGLDYANSTQGTPMTREDVETILSQLPYKT